MWQYKALNSDRVGILVTDGLLGFKSSYDLPPGLIGVNYKTGLVGVQLSQNKSTEMKYGRYLKKLGKDDAVVREESSKLSSQVKLYNAATLSLATSEEDIKRVYEDGPHSCMSNCEAVVVYAGPDTAVAYVELEDRIVARSVVVTNPDIGLQYVRVYGNEELMRKLLHDNGYTFGSLEGCRLLLVEGDHGILCPYLDNDTNVEVNAGYLVVDSSGEYEAQNTTGYVDSCSCEACNEPMHRDEQYFCEYREMSLCESCYNEGMVYVDGESYHEDSGLVKQTGDGDWIMEYEACWSDYYGEWYHQDDVTYCELEGDYYRNNEVSKPWCGDEDEFWAPTENCIWIRGVLVHENDEAEYRELNDIGEDECPNVEQGILRLAETSLAMCI